MRVKEAMSGKVRMVTPDQSIREAARLMAECDCGCLPVQENNRLVGMITDRDIALRAVAEGKSAKTAVSDIMTGDVKYCFDDQDLDEVASNMTNIKVRRLPVLNRDKRLVGILALGDIALTEQAACAGYALSGISEPGGAHTQAQAH